MQKVAFVIVFLSSFFTYSQEFETNPPFFIKTISFVQNGQNAIPVFLLGDSFQLQFDDLHATEDNYYYKITHCNYNWEQSQLSVNEYLIGFDEQRIQEYLNSQNTLQVYTHYRISFPNKLTQLRVSGNYIISILNENKEVIFSRKVIIYENLASVALQIKRTRTISDVQSKHNLDFTVKSIINFQSPLQNVKVLLLQNGNFKNAIYNVKPMYTIANDLIYKYDAETQFWAGNEYLNFDNKNIQVAVNSIAAVNSSGGLYNAFLFPNNPRATAIYTYFPDINGNFLVNNINAPNNEINADYAWVYFSLAKPELNANQAVYITGMYNNFIVNNENKMDFNSKTQLYEKALLIKQGFTNYCYTIIKNTATIDHENAIDGNFFQTENNYLALIYYRENNQRYDRVIGKGSATSIDITN